MSAISSLTEKPWESSGAPPPAVRSERKTRRTAIRVLLAVVSMLFFLFLVAFLMRSQYPDWQPLAEAPVHPLYDKTMLWFNTLYLLLGSVCIQFARTRARAMVDGKVKGALAIGGLFCIAFVAGQLVFWSQLTAEGFAVNANPALSFFYLLTGLHAAHVIVGVLVWLRAVSHSFSVDTRAANLIELCATYWHFLFGLWLLLFALLVSKPETYDAIAAFCGLR